MKDYDKDKIIQQKMAEAGSTGDSKAIETNSNGKSEHVAIVGFNMGVRKRESLYHVPGKSSTGADKTLINLERRFAEDIMKGERHHPMTLCSESLSRLT